jgi:tRNA (guanine-N7-)-methyltransferase
LSAALGKNKLGKFEELLHLQRVFQPPFAEIFTNDYPLKSKWAREVFGNNHPLILELGCGKGEYTIGLAKKYPESNVIGVDIKGARIWKGARQINNDNILNAAFLRTRIEFITSFFAEDEVQEIWLTFPDPQLKKRRNKKRLSGSVFLTRYQKFLVNGGSIHLKTDNSELFEYTRQLAIFNQLEINECTSDLYATGVKDDILGIKTFYEAQYLEKGIPIKYLKFRLDKYKPLLELPDENE